MLDVAEFVSSNFCSQVNDSRMYKEWKEGMERIRPPTISNEKEDEGMERIRPPMISD